MSKGVSDVSKEIGAQKKDDDGSNDGMAVGDAGSGWCVVFSRCDER